MPPLICSVAQSNKIIAGSCFEIIVLNVCAIGGEFKVVRGGSWRDLKGFIYSPFRNSGNPTSKMDDYGFRCAKSASQNSGTKKLTSRRVPANAG